MARLLSSDELGRLLDRHGPALRLYAAQWCAAPDDCVQEALIELARQAPPPDSPRAWLFRVVRRRAQNEHRGQRRRASREALAARREAPRDGAPRHGADLSPVEASDLLEGLDPQARELVVLRLWGGLSFNEIADVTDRPTSSLHRDYTAALERLRRLLEPDQDSPAPTQAHHAPRS
ncbi:RNA polymerase sigma factor SigL [Pirellulimonas nuda]|uniref:RNA polymerase sigma factor SigL n=1 Tax=Pirellulimonas nuda TaxID=2528009 RepID=A0A518DCJ8_9BACT|nr:sigma-70 family RNA polymerase sigma factor [Pirellulimonas nuda]QDU89156.1 RNA polymerase sigma factor SigL [Pirellulimonas nuda]